MNCKFKYFWLIMFFLFNLGMGFAQSTANINARQMDSMTSAWMKSILNKPLPTFIAAGDNGVVNNDSLKGKVTFINIWESHCAPCMAEMGMLNKLYDSLEDNPKFQFISISFDDLETIQKIREKYHIPYHIYHLDQEGCYNLNKGEGFPTYLILNEKAFVKYAHAGGYLDEEKVKNFIFSTDIYPAIISEL